MTPPAITIEELTQALALRAQDAADTIAVPGNCCSSQYHWTEEQWHSYADGQSRLLDSLAERFSISRHSLSLHQIDGALGERWRRRNPRRNQFCRRALNNLANDIRDLRIRMRDDYFLPNYQADLKPLPLRLAKLERKDPPVGSTNRYWTELNQIRRELEALDTFRNQCLSDRGWFDEVFRRHRIAAENARAIEVLEIDPSA